MPSARDFFADKNKVVKAIQLAEMQTSGEIRVHVEDHCKEDVLEHAKAMFLKMGMNQTAASNGVLIYIVSKDRKFAIIGDKALDEHVEPDFWSNTAAEMGEFFKLGKFEAGVCMAIEKVGQKLKMYFPYNSDNDKNELSDEISYGA